MKSFLGCINLTVLRKHYFKCIDDQGKPAGYVGDWPEAGKVYAGQVLPAAHTGVPHVHLDGFWAADPWGAFAATRFVFICTAWLN